MRLALVVLLLFASICFAQTTTCPTCDELAGRPQAQLTTLVDGDNLTLEVTAFYENATATPARQPLNYTVLMLQATPLTGVSGADLLYRIYTNANGKATFDFASIITANDTKGKCVNFKIVYCPFCLPESSSCGFDACMNYARISTSKSAYSNIGGTGTITNADGIPSASTAPATVSGEKYLPQLATASYCPPPPPLSATPALCLPLIIIFSLLSGALYVTGRNPFAGFNLGGARIGRHIRYQARGRGVSVSAMAVASATSSVAAASKTVKQGGFKELAKQEKAAATMRTFGLGSIKTAVAGISAYKSAKAAVAKAAQEKGAPLTREEKSGVMVRHMEAKLGGGVATGRAGAEQRATGKEAMFMPVGMGIVRGSELAFTSSAKNAVARAFASFAGTLGKVALFLLANSQPVQLVEAFRYAFTPRDRYQPLTELIFAKHDKRASNDFTALQEMKMKDGGIAVKLPDGKFATLVNLEPTPYGETKITLKVPKGESGFATHDGLLTVTVGKNGKLQEITCLGPNGNLVVLKANPEKGGTPILYVAGPDGKLVSQGEKPPKDDPARAAWVKAADPTIAAYSLGLRVDAAMGNDVKGFLKACNNAVESVGAINASFGREIATECSNNEKKIMEAYPPAEQKRMLAEGQDKVALEALALTLGRMASVEEFRSLNTSPLSNAAQLGSSIASAAGFNEKHDFTPREIKAVTTAIESVISSKSVAELSKIAQDPAQLKALLLPALPASMSQALNDNAIKSISSGMENAVHATTTAPVMAAAQVLGHSPLGTPAEFGAKLGKDAGFSEEQRNAIGASVSNFVSSATLLEVAALAKNPEKVKEIIVEGLVNNLAVRFMATGASQDDSMQAAKETVQRATSLGLKKDPLPPTREVVDLKRLSPAVSEAISVISIQFQSTGMSKNNADKEAEAMIRGTIASNFPSMAKDLGKAAQQTVANLDKEGFGKLAGELKSTDMSQLYALAAAKNDVVPADGTERARQFASTLAKNPDAPNVPADVKNLLQQREYGLNLQAQSQAIAGAFTAWGQGNQPINLAAVASSIGHMGNEYVHTYEAAMSHLMNTDPTAKKYDTPDPATTKTATGDLLEAAAQQANAARMERNLGLGPLEISSPPEDKVRVLARNETYKRQELDALLQSGDLSTAQAVCAAQTRYYRELGDTNTTDAWNKTLADVTSLKNEGFPAAPSGPRIMENLQRSAGKPEEVASSNVNYMEAQRASANHYNEAAMNRIDNIFSTNQPVVPLEAPKKGGGGKPPPETPPGTPETPPSREPPAEQVAGREGARPIAPGERIKIETEPQPKRKKKEG